MKKERKGRGTGSKKDRKGREGRRNTYGGMDGEKRWCGMAKRERKRWVGVG